MTVILIATQPEEVRNLLPWAAHIAASRSDDLTVLLAQRKKGNTRLVELPAEPSNDEPELLTQARVCLEQLKSFAVDLETADTASPDSSTISVVDDVTLRMVVGENRVTDLDTHVADLKPNVVILPTPVISKDQTSESAWQKIEGK